MITHIRMKNFKSWKDSGEVQLAPLTGFFGTNSSGKSSLLQMLLLLKQTTECENTQQVIFFGDETSYANLGDFREVIHGHKEEEKLELGFGYKLHKTYTIQWQARNEKTWQSKIDRFSFNTVISEADRKINVDNFSYADPSDSWKFFCHIQEITRRGFRGTLFINEDELGNAEVTNCYGTPVLEEINPYQKGRQRYLRFFSQVFRELFFHIYYLGPSRVNSRRHYNWEGRHPGHSGQWGDKTIDALLSARVRNLKTAHETEEVPIEQRISDWLQKMNLAHSFSLNWVEGQDSTNYEVRIQKTPSSPPVTLVDMGYGLSQFLPVLVLCYYAPEGSTLILEQPGIHLHPMVQSQISDLLIEVVTERKLQILVESHSEHLLTRLQRRIVEERIAADQTAFYFCRNDEGVSEIDELDVDEASGDIKNWPENFFGNVMGDMFAMTDKQVESIAEKGTEG